MENSNEFNNCCCCENPVLYTIPQKEVEHSCALDNVPFVISFYEEKLTTVSRNSLLRTKTKRKTAKSAKSCDYVLQLCIVIVMVTLKLMFWKPNKNMIRSIKNGSPFGRKRYKLEFRLCFTIRKTVKKITALVPIIWLLILTATPKCSGYQ